MHVTVWYSFRVGAAHCIGCFMHGIGELCIRAGMAVSGWGLIHFPPLRGSVGAAPRSLAERRPPDFRHPGFVLHTG